MTKEKSSRNSPNYQEIIILHKTNIRFCINRHVSYTLLTPTGEFNLIQKDIAPGTRCGAAGIQHPHP